MQQTVKIEDVRPGDQVLFAGISGGPHGTVRTLTRKTHAVKAPSVIKSSKGEIVRSIYEDDEAPPVPRETVCLDFGPHTKVRLDVGTDVLIQREDRFGDKTAVPVDPNEGD